MPRKHFLWGLLPLLLIGAVWADEVEVFTLSDGRVLTGIYDDEAQTITLSGALSATIRVPAAQIVSREPAGAAAPASPEKPALPIPGKQVDPAVLAPVLAASVPWESGDRVLILGDLLVTPGQPELALRLHEALSGSAPERNIVVFSMQNHGLSLEKLAPAACEEIARRPPKLVVVLAGVGDVVAALPPPAAPATPAAPLKLTLPSASAWRTNLASVVTAAQAAGAAVVLATPAIVGDKPFDGPGGVELDAYAEAVRSLAVETKAVLCDLRVALLAKLSERNARGTRELGLLSKAPGQLKPEAMDLCVGLLAQALAEAVPRIPWTVDLPGAAFTDTTEVIVRTPRIAADQVTVYITTDGSEPSDKSPVHHPPLLLTGTALVRVLAVARDGTRRTAQAWYMATSKLAAVPAPAETLPGLGVEHFAISDWGEGVPQLDDATSEVETWWPSCELAVLEGLPSARRPATLACLRYRGWFIAPYEGTYVFSLRSDGIARLGLGSLLVAQVKDAVSGGWQQGAIHLAKGYHPFTLCYGQGTGSSGRSLEVRVAEPGKRLQPLPELLLRRVAKNPDITEDQGDPAAPWTVRLIGGAFTGSTKAKVEVLRIQPERLNIHVTTDGSEPTSSSPLYSKPIPISSTTRVRVLALAKSGDLKASTEAWFIETRTHAADQVTGETLPGLWSEHCSLKRWVNPVASIDTMKANFTSWWPNAELAAYGIVPVHRWPDELFGLRWSGYFLAPVDGVYVFATNSDDASRVTFGTVPVVRNDNLHADRWGYGAVALTAGYHQLGLLYGQGPGLRTMDVYVALSGQRLQRLPDLLLRRPLQPPQRKGVLADPGDESDQP